MTAQTLPQRKYALTKLEPGDYLLPSNDAKTIWRIARYVDGPGHGLDVDWPSDRQVWGLWKWCGAGHPSDVEDIEDWSRWDQWASVLDTRQDAINEALRSS